jgi:hypothetical protein
VKLKKLRIWPSITFLPGAMVQYLAACNPITGSTWIRRAISMARGGNPYAYAYAYCKFPLLYYVEWI